MEEWLKIYTCSTPHTRRLITFHLRLALFKHRLETAMKKPRRRSILFSVILITVVCVFCGLIQIARQPAEQEQAVDLATSPPRLTSTPEPTSIPEPTRTSIVAKIPGIVPADVKVNLENHQLECDGPTSADLSGITYYSWFCQGQDGGAQLVAQFTSRSLNTIDTLEATVLQTEPASDSLSAAFLGWFATIPFIDQPDNQEQAADWVVQTIPLLTGEQGDIQTITINGIPLALYGLPTARTLEIGPNE